MDKEVVRRITNRPQNAHKYDFGHVLIVGGSPGMVGAPLLAGMAALRIGAGLATIAAPANVTDKLERRVKEIMTLPLPEKPADAVEALSDFVGKRKVNATVFGPGLKPETAAYYSEFLEKLAHPLVIDAGGLAAFSGRLSDLRKIAKNAEIIITPHTGEYEKLTGNKLPSGEKEVDQMVSERVKELGLTIVLKGHNTLIASPDGNTHRNTTGNPGLATAGTGDVLSGIIAGILAQEIEPEKAAQSGVYIHGLAGDLVAKTKTQAGLVASDVVESIPLALQKSTK